MPSERDIVERLSNDPIDRGDGHKAQYFLRAHANNCRLETAYLTAERMDECADILAAQATTIEAMRAENERLRGVLDNAASIAENATLSDGFRWGRDAMESFNFGRKRAALAIRAALQGGQSNEG